LSAFGAAYYASGSVPLLVVQGSADTVNSLLQRQLYDEAPAPKYYLDIQAPSTSLRISTRRRLGAGWRVR